jgi:rhodanese-related sulfurtransferase
MGTEAVTPIAELAPRDAWKMLSETDGARLIDVRSAAEWAFVGAPDLSALGQEVLRVEWQRWPGMAPNPDFLAALDAGLGDASGPFVFLCRSGARSLAAARALAQARGDATLCMNLTGGFEGDLDAEGHRGQKNGWKVSGLPWRQS